MPTVDNKLKNLEKLEAIVKLLSDGLTKEDFARHWEKVVAIIDALKKENGDFISKLDETVQTAQTRLQQDGELSKHELTTTIREELTSLMAAWSAKQAQIDEKLAKVRDGKDADEVRVLEAVRAQIQLPEYKETILDNAEQIRDKLEDLEGEERLDKTAIKGLEEFDAVVEHTKKGARIIHGPLGIQLFVGGVKKGGPWAKTLDFVAGTAMSISYSEVNGRPTMTFAVSGEGVTVVTPTGTVNASNTTFTVASQPQWVVSDGTTYYEGAGYSYVAGTITMDIAPSSFIRAIL